MDSKIYNFVSVVWFELGLKCCFRVRCTVRYKKDFSVSECVVEWKKEEMRSSPALPARPSSARKSPNNSNGDGSGEGKGERAVLHVYNAASNQWGKQLGLLLLADSPFAEGIVMSAT